MIRRRPPPAESPQLASRVVFADLGDQRLTPKEVLFVREYPKDWNGTEACLRAGVARTRTAAAFMASDMLTRPRVLLAINALLRERAQRIEASADEAARYWRLIAEADVAELSPARVGCYRYCWGIDHQYQFTRNELRECYREHRLKHTPRRILPHRSGSTTTIDDPPPLDDRGGDGFDQTRKPNPDCPECHGLGTWYLCPIDLDALSPGARAAFDGIKYNRDGSVEVRTRNRDVAMRNFTEMMGYIRPRRAIWEFDFDSLTPDQLDALIREARSRGLLRDDEMPEMIDATPRAGRVDLTPVSDQEERVS